jgi:hypothetical protein
MHALTPRDKHIGWTRTQKFRALTHTVNVGGLLTGGKFQMSACMSKTIADAWHRRYGNVCAAVDTTSLYGKSSVYNRIPGLHYLGNTGGGGIAHVSDEGLVILKRFMDLNGLSSRNSGTSGQVNSKLDRLIRVAETIGITLDKIATHQPRGVYFGPMGENTLPFLRGETTDLRPYNRTLDDVRAWWMDRWYAMRWPKVASTVRAFDANMYAVDEQIERCRLRGRSIEIDATVPTVEEAEMPSARSTTEEIT